MALFECIKDTPYGRVDYKVGDEMKIADSSLEVIHQDAIVSTCFRLKTKMTEPAKEPVKTPIAMSEVKQPLDDLEKIQNDIKSAKYVVQEPAKRGRPKKEEN